MLHTNFDMMQKTCRPYGLSLINHTVNADEFGNLRAGSFVFHFNEKTKTGLHKNATPISVGLAISRINNPNSSGVVMMLTPDGTAQPMMSSSSQPTQQALYAVDMTLHVDGIPLTSRRLVHSDVLTPERLCKEIFNIIDPYARIPKALDAVWAMFNDHPELVSNPKDGNPA